MIISFEQPIRFQPWRLLGSGLLRIGLGAALGGFALGLVRGGMLTPPNPGALLEGFLLIPVALFLLVVGWRRVRVAIHRRRTTGRWRSGPVERYLIL
jgi:hypothetical protein